MICSKSEKLKVLKPGQFLQLEIPDSNYTIHIYNSIDDFEHIWSQYENAFSIFLQSNYFRSLEEAKIDGLELSYLLVYRSQELIALVPSQLKRFDADKSIMDTPESTVQGIDIRKHVAKFVKFNTLVAGNLLVSGPYMYAFVKEVPDQRKFEITEKALSFYQNFLKSETNKRINMSFLKDVPVKHHIQYVSSLPTSFVPFEIEPFMMVNIRQEWNNIDDYLMDLSSKYRVRYRRAKKKLNGIQLVELDYDDIVRVEDQLYKLYLNVVENINFTLFMLSKHYFSNLKKHLGQKFRLFAYKNKHGLIVAFFTTIRNNNQLHAHYLGYDNGLNHEHQLYLNMLYQMVEQGIVNDYESIDFGRTALEIKSSVGAEPIQMNCYIKHKNSVANMFVPSLISILNRQTEWDQRHPFRTGDQ